MKTLGMIVGLIILGICVQNLSCKDKAEAVESKDIADPDNVTIKPEKYHVVLTDIEYKIVIQEPNHLVIEIWDKAGWYVNEPNAAVTVENYRRITVGQPYIIEINEPNHLVVKCKESEPNEPECKGHGVNAIYCPECQSLDYLLEPEFELVLNNTITDKFFEPNELKCKK